MKQLYYGDNLDVLASHIDDDSIDLIYLDPPFNSNRDYNANFSKSAWENDTAQMMAFEDSWRRNQQSEEMLNYMRSDDMIEYMPVSKMLDMFVQMLDRNDTAAYIAMMTPRLCLMHRKLKDTWSIYLHCDQTANSYLKVIMDKIFDKKNYKNEIVWIRSNPKSNTTSIFPNSCDVILRYSKSEKCYFQKIYSEHDEKYVNQAYRHIDKNGRYRLLPLNNPNNNRPNLTYEFLWITKVWRRTKQRMEKAYEDWIIIQSKNWWIPQYKLYLEDSKWKTVTNVRTDIWQASGNESLWYPTQKPIALLERILKASCPVDGVVLDPFCGCGTTLAAAESLNKSGYNLSRIGIDLTPLAINVIEKRLEEVYSLKSGKDFVIVGDPVDYAGAIKLAKEVDKYHFENWVLRLLNCIPSKYKVVWGKVIPLKWWDGWFDGFARFGIKDWDNKWLMVTEVKSGKVGRPHIDIFMQAMKRQWADIWVFVVLDKASMARDWYAEASKQWYYDFKWFQIPKIQIRNIEDHFHGIKPNLPFGMAGHIRWSKQKTETKTSQESLF